MGRYSGGGKEEADTLKKLNISWLKKHKYLQGYTSGTITWSYSYSDHKSSVGITSSMVGAPVLRLEYTQTDREGIKTNLDYKIPLNSTSCYFGGIRYWFTCPWYTNGCYCGRRVATLYLGNKYFACRHCLNLTYASRKPSGMWKVFGTTLSIPELEAQRADMRITHYAGKPTKRFRKWAAMHARVLQHLGIVEAILNVN